MMTEKPIKGGLNVEKILAEKAAREGSVKPITSPREMQEV
jgi:hypothetical protein